MCVCYCCNVHVNWTSGGYGSTTLNIWRQLYGTMHHGSEFPLTLGRDFSGYIVDMGCAVDQNVYRLGDAVSDTKQLMHILSMFKCEICVFY